MSTHTRSTIYELSKGIEISSVQNKKIKRWNALVLLSNNVNF